MGQSRDLHDRRNATQLVRREQHARVARVRGEGEHASAERGDRARAIERAEIGEQRERAFEGAGVGCFEPAKLCNVLHPARLQGEHDFGEVEPLHLGQLLRGPVVMLALGPQPHAAARRGAARAARALLGAGAGDALDEQRIDAAVRIEARDLRLPSVDDHAHAVDGQRSLGDVRGDDDLAPFAPRHRGVLLGGGQFAVQREHGALASGAGVADGGNGAADLVRAGHENEHIAFGLPADALEFLRRGVPHGEITKRLFEVLHIDRKRPPARGQQLAGREIFLQRARVERGGHDDEFEIGPPRFL